MTARSRELFGLLPVSLIVAAGFAAVLATRSEDVSDATLTYGAVFLGALPGGAPVHPGAPAGRRSVHVPDQRAARRGGARGDLPDRRRSWRASRPSGSWWGCSSSPGRSWSLRDHHVLERYRYTIAAASIALLVMPRLPGSRRAGERGVPGDQARADPVPARRVREARHHRLPRELPARDGRHPRAPAAAAAARPAPAAALRDPHGRSRCWPCWCWTSPPSRSCCSPCSWPRS